MSNTIGSRIGQPLQRERRPGGLRRRLPFYAGGVVIAVLIFAWFDGGEEPIRPIAQSVELPESSQ